MVTQQSSGTTSGKETAAKKTSSRRLNASLLLALGLLGLVGVVLVARLDTVNDIWLKNSTNATLLRFAMDAAAGEQVPSSTSLPRNNAGTGLNGTQARALALIAQSNGNNVQAERWLLQGLNDGETAELTRFELCRLYLNSGRPEQARDSCRNHRASAAYWLRNGLRAEEAGQLEKAVAYYDMAVTADPLSTLSWTYLGLAYDRQGRTREAVSAYERILILLPEPPATVFAHLGDDLLALDRIEQARRVLNEGLEQYPDERQYYLSLAQSYRNSGDLETADQWYAQLVQRRPQDGQVWALRGENSLEAGEPLVALGYYEDAVRYEPETAGYWLGLALAASDAGHVPQATDAFEKALALHPDDANIMVNAGRFFAANSQFERAEKMFERALALEPANSEAAERLSEIQSPGS